jgi:hypothetical protein
MRVMFVGSFEPGWPAIDSAKRNLRQLIEKMVGHGVELVIRNPKYSDTDFIPVDAVVYECLEKCITANQVNKSEIHLTVVKEVGREDGFAIELPHRNFSAADSYRINFYRQFLSSVDLVVGVGGRDGLIRQAMLCEASGKPVFFLPGSGGTADILWGEFFLKNFQMQYFTEKQLHQLRATPYINVNHKDYGPQVYDILKIVHDTVSKRSPHQEIIAYDHTTPRELWGILKRFSFHLWMVLAAAIISLLSFGYWLGHSHFIERFLLPAQPQNQQQQQNQQGQTKE